MYRLEPELVVLNIEEATDTASDWYFAVCKKVAPMVLLRL